MTSNIPTLVAKLGTDAVLRYREISRSIESVMPEVFLGGYVGSHLYDHIQFPIHVERPYDKMADELGITDTTLIAQMKNQRADLVLYREDGSIPTDIIEFKIFDEGTQPRQVFADLVKAKRLADLRQLSVILGVVICETTSTLESRKELLEKDLRVSACYGEAQESLDGQWRWCFGCSSSSLTDLEFAVEGLLGR